MGDHKHVHHNSSQYLTGGDPSQNINAAITGPSVDEMLEILKNGFKDAGTKLLYAIMVVFPAVMEQEGEKINGLSELLDKASDINNEIAALQQLFNEAQHTNPGDKAFDDKVRHLANKLAKQINWMESQVKEGVFDQSLVDSMKSGFHAVVHASVHVLGEKWIKEWKDAAITNPDDVSKSMVIKQVFDGFNTMKTGITGFSSGMQTELKMETENINQMMAAMKDIAQNFNQMEKAPNQKPAA